MRPGQSDPSQRRVLGCRQGGRTVCAQSPRVERALPAGTAQCHPASWPAPGCYALGTGTSARPRWRCGAAFGLGQGAASAWNCRTAPAPHRLPRLLGSLAVESQPWRWCGRVLRGPAPVCPRGASVQGDCTRAAPSGLPSGGSALFVGVSGPVSLWGKGSCAPDRQGGTRTKPSCRLPGGWRPRESRPRPRVSCCSSQGGSPVAAGAPATGAPAPWPGTGSTQPWCREPVGAVVPMVGDEGRGPGQAVGTRGALLPIGRWAGRGPGGTGPASPPSWLVLLAAREVPRVSHGRLSAGSVSAFHVATPPFQHAPPRPAPARTSWGLR